MAETIIVELGTKHFQEANAAVRAALAEADTVCIVEAYAQRYLGCTLPPVCLSSLRITSEPARLFQKMRFAPLPDSILML